MWPSDIIWPRNTGSIFPQAMVWTKVDLISSVRPGSNHRRTTSQEIPQPLISIISKKTTYLKPRSTLPGIKELKYAPAGVLSAAMFPWKPFLPCCIISVKRDGIYIACFIQMAFHRLRFEIESFLCRLHYDNCEYHDPITKLVLELLFYIAKWMAYKPNRSRI